MLKETGRIVAMESDALWVETIQQSTCNSCVAKQGCGQSLLSKVGIKSTYIRVLLFGKDRQDYKVGQLVTIGIPNDVVVKSSLFVYLVPLLLMIAFSGFAHTYIENEFISIGAGLFGLLVGGLLIRYYTYKATNDPRIQPVLIDNGPMVIMKG
ncbi:transcriptional regulator [Candidatus Endobugula sertula]|uniref:Transcriptional regulator n=1 Tax=Candidatus Endobugula sertula TaxID=62101 RepID=A0A1D2QN85_9GAMM|nr:transcriptional regulator [Candidatus Endobugula sertula]